MADVSPRRAGDRLCGRFGQGLAACQEASRSKEREEDKFHGSSVRLPLKPILKGSKSRFQMNEWKEPQQPNYPSEFEDLDYKQIQNCS